MVAAWNNHGGCSDQEAVTVNEMRNKIYTQPGQQSVPAEFLPFIDVFSFFIFLAGFPPVFILSAGIGFLLDKIAENTG